MILAATLPLAAQPKLLVNAKLDTHSAAQGLDHEFQALVAATPQPSWIAYSVPSTRTMSLGCEFVSHDGAWWSTGTVHLEPPDHALILFRVVAGAVERVRMLSPDCEIDAGDTPFHWLTDVQPGPERRAAGGVCDQGIAPLIGGGRHRSPRRSGRRPGSRPFRRRWAA